MSAPIDGALALRALAEHAFSTRRRLLAIGAGVAVSCLVLGLALPPRYVSHSTLVFLLGPEYTVRAPADAGPPANTAFDADHILGTETAILSSDDLSRDVIRAVGLRRLYPKLLQPPGLLARLATTIKSLPDALARAVGTNPPRAHADDPTEEAVAIFSGKLEIRPSKLASVITLGFSHRDPAIARETLAVLERLYLQRRRALYGRQDSQAMGRDVARARAALDEADAALAEFQDGHALPDYATQLDILLRAQGDVEHDAIEARRAQAAGQARIGALELERTHLPAMLPGGSDSSLDAHTAATRDGIEALRARAAETLARYRAGSPTALDIEAQIATRTGELADTHAATLSATHTIRNAAFDATSTDLVQLRANDRALAAQLADDRAEAAAIAGRIAGLGRNQRTLDGLTTRRTVLLDDLRNLEQAASREVDIEAVEATSPPAVRIAAAPSLPVHPKPIPLLLTIAGLILGGFATVGAALAGHAIRRTVLLAEEVEPLGVRLLARIPRGDPLAALPPIMPLAI